LWWDLPVASKSAVMQEDDNLLRSMSQAGKSLRFMTVKLNRPRASIRARAVLGKRGPGLAAASAGAEKHNQNAPALAMTGAPVARLRLLLLHRAFCVDLRRLTGNKAHNPCIDAAAGNL